MHSVTCTFFREANPGLFTNSRRPVKAPAVCEKVLSDSCGFKDLADRCLGIQFCALFSSRASAVGIPKTSMVAGSLFLILVFLILVYIHCPGFGSGIGFYRLFSDFIL